VGGSNKTGFISPFSIINNYTTEWTKHQSNYRGAVGILEQLTDRDIEIVKLLGRCGLATSMQLGKTFWVNPKRGTKRLNLLSRQGVLTRHRLVSSKNTLIIHALGPLGAYILDCPFSQWWLDLDTAGALEKLIAAQLYLRFYKTEQIKDLDYFSPAPPPFTGVLKLGGIEFAVLAARDMGKKFEEALAPRIFVIGETKEHLAHITGSIKHDSVRLTTDEHLFKHDIENMFLVHNDGKLEEERIQFDAKAQPKAQTG